MEQVRRGMVAADSPPAGRVDPGIGLIAGLDEPFGYGSPVNEDVRCRLDRVIDIDQAGIGPYRAGVADLATGLTVKRSPVENDLDRLAGFGDVECAVRADDGEHAHARLD